jgi:hypothetical protein
MARAFTTLAGLLIILMAASFRPAHAEMAMAGAGSAQCDLVNSNAVPGRGTNNNFVAQMLLTWVQGYMSGFNGYSLMVNKTSPFDLGATSPEAQWEYIVSYCRSHPTDFIVKAIQEVQLKLLKK